VAKNRSRNSKASKRKEEVARATWALLAKNGFEPTSMREIAHELGTTTGTLTHYFRNKEDMVEFTNEFMYNLLLQRLSEADAGPRKNKLWRSIRALLPVRKAHLDNHRVWLSFITSGFGKPTRRTRNRRILKDHVAQVRGIVDEDREARARTSRINATDETDLLVSLTQGLATLAAVDQKSFSPERVDHLAKVAFDLIVGKSPT